MKNKIKFLVIPLLFISCNNRMCPLQDGFVKENNKHLYDMSDSFDNLYIKSTKPKVYSFINGKIKKIVNKDNKNIVFITSEPSKKDSVEIVYVYSNLEEVFVKEGEKVSKGTEIGKVLKQDSEYILVLSVLEGTKKVDPKLYIDCKILK